MVSENENGENELGQPIGWPVALERADPPSTEPMVGRYCTLEALDPERHTNELFEAYAEATDDGDWTYLPYGPFASPTDFAAFTTRFAAQPDPVFFTVVDAATGVASGLASYLRIDAYAASIEVGHIHFARRIQQKPATTEAMYLMMKRAFETGYRRYEWKCDSLNGPSRSAAARLGFSYEGEFRQATHYKGRNRDTAWFALIDRDWPARAAEFERWLDPANFTADGVQRSPLDHGVR